MTRWRKYLDKSNMSGDVVECKTMEYEAWLETLTCRGPLRPLSG